MRVRIGVTVGVALLVALSCSSCGGMMDRPSIVGPVSTEAELTPEAEATSEAEPGAIDSLGFDEGDLLDPAASVGWSFSFVSDAEWTPADDVPEGAVDFVHANGSCTARYIQEVIEPSAADDSGASDAFLADLTGDTVESNAPYVFDGEFALTGLEEDPDGTVASRTILLGDETDMWLVAVRVFTALDPSIHGMSNAYTLELNCLSGVNPEDVVDSLDAVAAITVTQPTP